MTLVCPKFVFAVVHMYSEVFSSRLIGHARSFRFLHYSRHALVPSPCVRYLRISRIVAPNRNETSFRHTELVVTNCFPSRGKRVRARNVPGMVERCLSRRSRPKSDDGKRSVWGKGRLTNKQRFRFVLREYFIRKRLRTPRREVRSRDGCVS